MRSWVLCAIGLAMAVVVAVSAFGSSTGKIAGKVTDEKGEPIPGVSVKIDSTTMGTAADINGDYVILNVPAGTYSLSASTVGYNKTTIKNVQVQADVTTEVNFKLISSATKAQDIVVTAGKKTIDKYICSNSYTKTADQIRAMPVGNPGQLIKSTTGIVDKGGLLHSRGGRAGTIPNIRAMSAPFNTENYDRIYDNEFLAVTDNPLSTFSIDVDAASYSNIRRFINGGHLPPPDAVRIEEMINYFSYEYPQPRRRAPFTITSEISGCPWSRSHKLVMIGLQGRDIDTKDLPPSNLVFLLDVSGSMASPNKLPLLKSAFFLLVDKLRKQDRVAIVVYAGAAGLILPSTPGSDKEKILSAIDNLRAGGCTAGGAGIRLAYDVAAQYFFNGGNNRVILATDGDFNVGLSSDADMVRLIEDKRQNGIFLSVLGFGEGNLKDSRMEKIADKGNGNYFYIDNIMEARKVLVSEMGATLYTIAKDVKLQVEFNPTRVESYRLIGYEDRLLAKEDFNDDQKDAGEMGAGRSVTALYEIVPAGTNEKRRSVDPLKYQSVELSRAAAQTELMTVKIRYKEPDGSRSRLVSLSIVDDDKSIEDCSRDFRFCAAVAEVGMLLRNSSFKGDGTYDQAIELARNSKGDDREGYRAEFIRLAENCRNLATVMVDQDR